MFKKVLPLLFIVIFLIGSGCSNNAMKYNKSRNGGKRINSKGSMRR